MDPDLLKAIENATRFTQSPEFQLALKAATSPAFLDAQRLGAKVQKLAANPDILATHNAFMAASKGLNIAQLNSTLSQFKQIPAESFNVFKQVAAENSSELRNIVKANYETISNMFEQNSKDDADKELVVPETVAELVTDADDTIEFPEPDDDRQIRIPLFKGDRFKKPITAVYTAVCLIATSFIDPYGLYSIHQSNADTELRIQQHDEIMQLERRKIQLLKCEVEFSERTAEAKEREAEAAERTAEAAEHAVEYLKIIAENTAPK